MTDPAITPAPISEQDTTLPPPQQMESPPQPNIHPNLSIKTSAISFSVWPPTQRTRDAVINRLIETLSTPSVLSKRYGTLSSDEASTAARQIEEEAFVVAGASASADEDGIEIVQAYSKEISKRMIDIVKARAPPSSSVNNGGASVITTEDGNAASVSEA